MNILEDICLWLPKCSIVSFSSFMIWWRTLHSIIVVIFGPYNAFPNGEMEISVWVHMTFLTYLTWNERFESDMMERSGCVLLCCDETGA